MDGSGKHPCGLYTFLNGKVKALQTFHEEGSVENKRGKFDWQSEAEEMSDKKFTHDYIFDKYIAPFVMALFEKKLKKTGPISHFLPII